MQSSDPLHESEGMGADLVIEAAGGYTKYGENDQNQFEFGRGSVLNPAIDLRDMVRNKLISSVEVVEIFLNEGFIAGCSGL